MKGTILLSGVGKRYRKIEERPLLIHSLFPATRPRRSDLWALRAVDLSIAPGETVGILGHNGSGKTTLLRMMCGVTKPTEGRVRVVGRIAPIIAVGVGFHRELSGRENTKLNAMLLGLHPDEVEERLDEIVDFADLEEFINTPVKFYSSGMFLRLGFSVAVHTRPDILLLDEILTVADLPFQSKCLERIHSIQSGGTTTVIVTHSISLLRSLCRRVVVVSRGRISFDGDPEAAIEHYGLDINGHGAADFSGRAGT